MVFIYNPPGPHTIFNVPWQVLIDIAYYSLPDY